MRRVLLLLVCLLLALQGLLGSSMALAAWAPPAALDAAHAATSVCHETPAAAPEQPNDAPAHGLCALCSLCHATPWLGATVAPRAAPRSAPAPQQHSPDWQSAALAPALKPPIT